MKTIILIIVFSGLVFAQHSQKNHKSVIARMNVATGGGAAIPDIIYQDTSFTASSGSDTLGFDYPVGEFSANDMLMLVLFAEDANTRYWGTGDDTVSVPDWNFVRTSGNGQCDAHAGIFYKIADGTETGHFTVHGLDSREQAAFFLVVDSVDVTSPINVVGDTSWITRSSNPVDLTLKTATTDEDNCLIIGVMGVYETADWPTYHSVAGKSWVWYDYTFNRSSPYTGGAGIIVQKDLPSAGVTGATTVTYTGGGNGGSGASGFVIAIKGVE